MKEDFCGGHSADSAGAFQENGDCQPAGRICRHGLCLSGRVSGTGGGDGGIFYSFQLYCDFSGYSDIAIGMGNLLGIRSRQNFRCPYFARNIRDFWNRWHISLSSWLRDYVYIPLGGSRVSQVKRGRNVLLTFLASGLWHGDNWTFVMWGGIHGVWNLFSRKRAWRQPGLSGGFGRPW